jgi:hypothetical protein
MVHHKELQMPDQKSAFLMIDAMAKDGVPERVSFMIVGNLFQTDQKMILHDKCYLRMSELSSLNLRRISIPSPTDVVLV